MLNKKYFEVLSHEETSSFIIGAYEKDVSWYKNEGGKWVEDAIKGTTRGIKIVDEGKEKVYVDDEKKYSIYCIDFEVKGREKVNSTMDIITAEYQGEEIEFINSDFKGRYRYDFK